MTILDTLRNVLKDEIHSTKEFFEGILSIVLFIGSSILGVLGVYSFISMPEQLAESLDNVSELNDTFFLYIVILFSMFIVSFIQLIASISVLLISVGDIDDNFLNPIPIGAKSILGICCLVMTTVNNEQLMHILESDTFGLLFVSFQKDSDTDDIPDTSSDCNLLPVDTAPITPEPYDQLHRIFTVLFYGRITFMGIGLWLILISIMEIGIGKSKSQRLERWYRKSKIFAKRSRVGRIMQVLSFFPMLLYSIASSLMMLNNRFSFFRTEPNTVQEEEISIENNVIRSLSILILNLLIIVTYMNRIIRNKVIPIQSIDILGVYFCFLWGVIYFDHNLLRYWIGIMVIVTLAILPPFVFVLTMGPRFIPLYIRREIMDLCLWFGKVIKAFVFVNFGELETHPLHSVFIVIGLFGLICSMLGIFLPIYDLTVKSGPLIKRITDQIEDAADDIDDLVGSLTNVVSRFDPCYQGLQYGDTVIGPNQFEAFLDIKKQLKEAGVSEEDSDVSVSFPSSNGVFNNNYLNVLYKQCEDQYDRRLLDRNGRKKCKKRIDIMRQQSLKRRTNTGSALECVDFSLVPVFDEQCRKVTCATFLTALTSTYALLFVPFVGSIAAPAQTALRVLKETFKLGKRFLRKVRNLATHRKRYRRIIKLFKRIQSFFQDVRKSRTTITIKRGVMVMFLPTFIIGTLVFNIGFWDRIMGQEGALILFGTALSCTVAQGILTMLMIISEIVFIRVLEKLPNRLFYFDLQVEIGANLIKIGMGMVSVAGFWLSIVFWFKLLVRGGGVETIMAKTNNGGGYRTLGRGKRYTLGSGLIACLFIVPVLGILYLNMWPRSDRALIFKIQAVENRDLDDIRSGSSDMEQVAETITEVRDDSESINNACDLIEKAIELIVKSVVNRIAETFSEVRELTVGSISGGINELLNNLKICNSNICSLDGPIDTIQNLILFLPILITSVIIILISFFVPFFASAAGDVLLAFSISIVSSGFITLVGAYGLFSIFNGLQIPFFDLRVVTDDGFYISLLCYLLCLLSILSLILGLYLKF